MYPSTGSYYDKVIGTWQSFLSTFRKAEYRKMAFLGSIPKWKGFSVINEEIEQMTATEAIDRLGNAMHCLSHVWIEESSHYRRKQPSQFNSLKVSGSNG